MASAKGTSSATSSEQLKAGEDRKKSTLKLPRKKRPSFVCIMCQKKFRTHGALKEHFRDFHSENCRMCPECKSALARRLSREHGTNIDIRGRPMEQTTLLKHPKEVAKTAEVQCDYCPATFPNISRALNHKFRRHKTESNSFCEFCGKLFPLKILLEQHKTKCHIEKATNKAEKGNSTAEENSGGDKCNCPLCPATFMTVEALKFHFHGAHQVSYDFLMPIYVPPPSTKIKLNNASEAHSVYYCHHCGSEYILKHNLRKHIRDDHTVKEWYAQPEELLRCKTCSAFFCNERAYTAHLTYHRPGDWHLNSEEEREKVLARVDHDFDSRRIPTKGEEVLRRIISENARKRPDSTRTKPCSSKSKEESSDEGPLSPPSTPSDSEDEEPVKSTDNSLPKEAKE